MGDFECVCCICGCLLGRARFKQRRRRRKSRSVQRRESFERQCSENETFRDRSSQDGSPEKDTSMRQDSEPENAEYPIASEDEEDDDDDNEPGGRGYDQDALSIEDSRWTNEFRALGWNEDTDASFLTGSAEQGLYGCVKVSRGDDPNFPEDALDEDGWASFDAHPYGGESDWLDVAPFHDLCFEMLSQYIQSLTGSDEEVRSRWFYNSLSRDSAPIKHIDYGEGYPGHNQFWSEITGEEMFVANPFWSRSIEKLWADVPFYEAPPSLAFNLDGQVQEDPFSEMPAEIIYDVFELLPMEDILALRQASWFVLRVELSNFFWKQRLKLDMPWFWELKHISDATDFKSLFGLLEARTRYRQYPESKTKSTLGLANRRRIWHICEQISDNLFHRRKPSLVRFLPNDDSGFIESHSKVAQEFPTALPVTKSMESVKTFWIRSWRDVDTFKADFNFYWSVEGSLVGIRVDFGNIGQRDFGSTDVFEKMETVSVGNDDWVDGMVLNIDGKLDPREEKHSAAIKGIQLELTSGTKIVRGSFETGHKRHLPISPGHVLVGAVGKLSPSGPIAEFGFLECCRPGHSASSSVTEADKMLWKDELLPSPSIRALPFKLGSLQLQPGLQFAPHESLIFGLNDDEMSKMTRISACVRPGGLRTGLFVPGGSRVEYSIAGFRVDYTGDLPFREIGECADEFMKSFEVDGAAGERITTIHIEMCEWAKNVKFFTNRGRSSEVFGDYGLPNWNWKNDQKARTDETLIGMCATFGLARGYQLGPDGKPDLTPTHRTATTISGLTMPSVEVSLKVG